MFLHYRKNGVGDRWYYDYLSRPSNRHSDFNLIFVFFSKCCVGRMSYSGIECDLPEVTRANYLGILLFHTENFEKSSNDDFTMKKMQNTAHVQRTCAHVQCTCAHVQRVDFKNFDSKFSLISHSEFVLNQVRFQFFSKISNRFRIPTSRKNFPFLASATLGGGIPSRWENFPP